MITKSTLCIFSITILGAILRIYGLSDESLRLDEGFMYARISGSFYSALTHWDLQWQGVLFPLLEKLWCAVFGYSEFAMRLLPAIFGILSIPALYVLGKSIFSETAGIIAALLLAVNPCAIFFSQDARPYTFFLLICIVSIELALRSLHSEKRLWQILFLISAIFGLYAHPYGVFLLPFLISIPFLLHCEGITGERRKRYFVYLGRIAVGYLPMLVIFAQSMIGKMEGKLHDADFIPQATIALLADTINKYFMSATVAVIVVVIIVAGLLVAVYRRNTVPNLRLLYAILICFLVLPWLVSYFVTPIFFFRYTIPALVALFLLLGWISTLLNKPLRLSLLVILLASQTCALADYYTKVDKDPWRQTVALIKPILQTDDVIIINPFWMKSLLDYYLPANSVKACAPQNANSLKSHLENAPRFWLITDYKFPDAGRAAMRKIADSCGIQDLNISVRDSLTLNPRAYFIGDIRAELYHRK